MARVEGMERQIDRFLKPTRSRDNINGLFYYINTVYNHITYNPTVAHMYTSLKKQLSTLVILAVAFIGVSFLAHTYHSEISVIMHSGGVWGIIFFIFLTAIFVIFVIPLDIVFLIPIGAVVYGPIPTALMSITGWTLGAAAAFAIARYFGKGFVGKLLGLDRVRAIGERIPKRNMFWTVFILRMLISVDILSYALGLFSDMSWGIYVFATMLGVAPFGFYFAYAGSLPLWYQLGAVIIAIIIATIIVMKYTQRR